MRAAFCNIPFSSPEGRVVDRSTTVNGESQIETQSVNNDAILSRVANRRSRHGGICRFVEPGISDLDQFFEVEIRGKRTVISLAPAAPAQIIPSHIPFPIADAARPIVPAIH